MTSAASVALVGEDTAHAALLCTLLRATLRDAALDAGQLWIAENLTHDPELHGSEDLSVVLEGLRYTNSIRGVDAPHTLSIGGRPVKTRGHMDGAALAPEGHKWRVLLLHVLATFEPTAVLVAKDTDGDPEALRGLRQVVRFYEARNPHRIFVIAAPHRDAECWMVAGFEANSPTERDALAAATKRLSFSPTTEPDRLTAHPNDAPTDAKRVLRQLLGLDDDSRPLGRDELVEYHERLLSNLPRLRARGAGTGLVDFLDALATRVSPALFPMLAAR